MYLKKDQIKKKKVSITKLKKKLEKLVKEYVKKRDGYVCQMCGKKVEGSNCHASHVIPVSGGGAFQFDPLNLKTLCYHCHLNVWHKNPVQSAEWFKNKFPDRYNYLFNRPATDRLRRWKSWELEAEIEKYKILNKQNADL